MWNIVGLNKSRYMLVEFSESADVAYRKLQQILAETEIRLLGCILNGTVGGLGGYGSTYGYGYGYSGYKKYYRYDKYYGKYGYGSKKDYGSNRKTKKDVK